MRRRHQGKRLPPRQVKSARTARRVGRKSAVYAQGSDLAARVDLLKRYVDSAERFGDKTETIIRRYTACLAGCLAVLGFVLNGYPKGTEKSLVLGMITLAGFIFGTLLVASVRVIQADEQAMWGLVYEQEKQLPGKAYTRLHETAPERHQKAKVGALCQYDLWGVVIVFGIFAILFLMFWILGWPTL